MATRNVPQSNKERFKVAILSFWFFSQNLSEILKQPVTINIALLLALVNYSEAATGGVLKKKGVLKNFPKLTGKPLCQSLSF